MTQSQYLFAPSQATCHPSYRKSRIATTSLLGDVYWMKCTSISRASELIQSPRHRLLNAVASSHYLCSCTRVSKGGYFYINLRMPLPNQKRNRVQTWWASPQVHILLVCRFRAGELTTNWNSKTLPEIRYEHAFTFAKCYTTERRLSQFYAIVIVIVIVIYY